MNYCPKCYSKIDIIKPCDNCGFETSSIKDLISQANSYYKRAILYLKKENYYDAWQNIVKSVTCYPFNKDSLYLSILLSIELGYYRESIKLLETFAKIAKDQAVEISVLVRDYIDRYNHLIELGEDENELSEFIKQKNEDKTTFESLLYHDTNIPKKTHLKKDHYKKKYFIYAFGALLTILFLTTLFFNSDKTYDQITRSPEIIKSDSTIVIVNDSSSSILRRIIESLENNSVTYEDLIWLKGKDLNLFNKLVSTRNRLAQRYYYSGISDYKNRRLINSSASFLKSINLVDSSWFSEHAYYYYARSLYEQNDSIYIDVLTNFCKKFTNSVYFDDALLLLSGVDKPAVQAFVNKTILTNKNTLLKSPYFNKKLKDL